MGTTAYCPKCRKPSQTTEHQYYDSKHNLIRTEEACDQCHQTILIRHYQPKKNPFI